jgi:hypothetical protein
MQEEEETKEDSQEQEEKREEDEEEKKAQQRQSKLQKPRGQIATDQDEHKLRNYMNIMQADPNFNHHNTYIEVLDHTTTGFGQKTHFWTKKNMASETLIFFLFGVFFCHVKPISYESIFWRSYGVRSVPFWSICRVWGKISLRGHQNQLHGYIVLQST